MRRKLLNSLAEVNKELWVLLSLFAIALLLNYIVASHQMVLGLYAIPTLFSAFFYGRRHATLTALASVLVVLLLMHFNPLLLAANTDLSQQKWIDFTIWGGILVITGYTMGTLHEQREHHIRELRQTYHGVLLILCQFISNDKYTQHHSYRVSIYGAQIASCMGLDSTTIEDIRAAALLHDIGKLDVSREVLYKAARLSEEEHEEISHHTFNGAHMLEPVGGSLRRIIPIVLAHHDKFDGSGPTGLSGDKIPLAARVITVADVYDALTSDRPYRKAMSPFEARQMIQQGAGTEFDPKVVDAFMEAFRLGLLEVPEVLV